jgi:signal transduction histidine kinase
MYGLNRYNKDTGIFKNYTTENGLVNNTIAGILEDSEGNLWISTYGGLSKFDLKTEVFLSYGAKNGLQGDGFNQGAYYKNKDGELFFGGLNGLYSFYPNEIETDTNIPPVLITAFNVEGGHVTLNKPIEDVDSITLPYRENSFTIEFAALDYISPMDNQYAYKLEGFDKDWRYCSAGRNFATYTNIPGGEYTFRVIASNSDGVWNEEGVSLKLNISPPFWQEWWFILSLTSLALLAVVIIIRLRTRVISVHAQKLENQVIDRTRGLEEKINQSIYFSRALVHELKTPLTSLLGSSELLANNIKTEPWTKLANNVNQSAEQLNKRVNELLMFTRGELGILRIQLGTVNPAQLLMDVYNIASDKSFLRGGHIILEISDNLPIIKADYEKIQQVLLNLLDNAFKYSAVNKIITLSCKKTGDYLEFSVKDNGFGIPFEKQDLLFNPYCRIQSQEDSNIMGLGLGLSICKNIVELHKGQIWVESKEGTGSTFSFSIPINLDDND